MILNADQEVAIADVQKQVVALRLCETVPVKSPVGESQSNGRVDNAVNSRIRSSDTVFPWIVKWSAGLVTRYLKSQAGRTAYIVEESGDKNENLAADIPPEEDYAQELAEAWDDIDGQELDSETVKKARALEMEWYRKMNVHEKRPVEERFEKTMKPPSKVTVVRSQRWRQTTRKREVEASGKANQHRQ